MTIVAICGSKSISPESLVVNTLRNCIKSYASDNVTFYVGDVSGIDYIVQSILRDLEYTNVVVWYVMGESKHNLGKDLDWKTEYVKPKNYNLRYTERDTAMLGNSDELLAVWDGISKGTKRNIDNSKKSIVLYEGVNISSNSSGIGGALSINDVAARKTGKIKKEYPVNFNGKSYEGAIVLWKDSEAMATVVDPEDELLFWGSDSWKQDEWMTAVLKAKFLSNPDLLKSVKDRGGKDWLYTCNHVTDEENYWTGLGKNSIYIECLVKAYIEVLENELTE
ncbi:MAG: hypothetical protein MGG11_06560 [Trichodesmium sp. MAG_R03]|nr:hypothetical protein [Trichodesmium sp. MAG_R03]